MPKAAILALLIGMAPTVAHADDGVLMRVTGYVDNGTTADGSLTAPGVAACPLRMAFGTVLDIEGVGQVVCHDRTPGNFEVIDVWCGSLAQAYATTGYRRVWVMA